MNRKNNTAETSQIPFLLLQAALEKISEEYIKRGLDSVELGDRQLYHAVAAGEMFDMTKIPTDLVTGDLEDDWRELKLLVRSDRLPSSVDLERLGHLLIALSEAVLD